MLSHGRRSLSTKLGLDGHEAGTASVTRLRAPAERRRIELPFYASAITRRGAQLAIGGSELALLDPDSLEVTHRLDQGTGDRASLSFLEDALVYSNQGGVASVALVCAP